MDTSGQRIVPSQPDYWLGTPGDNEMGFTREQVRALARMGGIPITKLNRFRLPATHKHVVMLERGGHSEHPCPVLGGRKDRTRLQVIAPNGDTTWVDWKGGQNG